MTELVKESIEEKCAVFDSLVSEAIKNLADYEQKHLLYLGRCIKFLHLAKAQQENGQNREGMKTLYDRIGGTTNPNVIEALIEIIKAETSVF